MTIVSLSALTLFNNAMCSDNNGFTGINFFMQYDISSSDFRYPQHTLQPLAQALAQALGRQNQSDMNDDNLHGNQQHVSNINFADGYHERNCIQASVTVTHNPLNYFATIPTIESLYHNSVARTSNMRNQGSQNNRTFNNGNMKNKFSPDRNNTGKK